MAERRVCSGLWALEFLNIVLQVWHEKWFSRLNYAYDNWTSSSQAFLGADYFYSQRSTITIHKTTTAEICVEVHH